MFIRHTIAAALYGQLLTASYILLEEIRYQVFQLLGELANKFENGKLHSFQCCNSDIFRGFFTDSDNNYAYTRLNISLTPANSSMVLEKNKMEVHANMIFKVVLVNMGNQLLSIHCMNGNLSISIAYVLMEAKSRNVY